VIPRIKLEPSRIGLVLSASTVLQILMSFGLQSYVVAYSGGRAHADAFYAGGTLPQMASVMLIDTLPLVLVPLFSAVNGERLRQEVWQILAAGAGIAAMLSAVIAFGAGPLMTLLVPGFSMETRALTINLTQIQALGLWGAAWTAILTSVCHAKSRFLLPPAAVLVSLAGAWALVVFNIGAAGIVVGAWAQVVLAFVPALIMLPIVGYPTASGWSSAGPREVWRRLRPVALGKAYYVATSPFDRLLTSFLPSGSLVTFELISRSYASLLRVLSQGILAPHLPHLSRLAATEDWAQFRATYRRQSKTTLVFSVAALVAAEVGVLLILPRLGLFAGSLNLAELNEISVIVSYVGGALPCMALVNVLSNAFYARGDSTSPARIGVIAYTIGLGIRLAGFWIAGIRGIALAATVWSAVHLFLLNRALNASTQIDRANQTELAFHKCEVVSR
jgi:putative peptidoglycan lipid II flippase